MSSPFPAVMICSLRNQKNLCLRRTIHLFLTPLGYFVISRNSFSLVPSYWMYCFFLNSNLYHLHKKLSGKQGGGNQILRKTGFRSNFLVRTVYLQWIYIGNWLAFPWSKKFVSLPCKTQRMA